MNETAQRAALRVEHLTVRYPSRDRRGGEPVTALDDVSITIEPGERVGLLGPNGSGKSTLMQTICGLLRPNAGNVHVFGETHSDEARASLGVVFQSVGLDAHLTVDENLRDTARLYGIPDPRTRIDNLLKRADLTTYRNSLVKTLSGGFQRRVDLCRALVHTPRLLLLDEPTVGLDPQARERFMQQVLEPEGESSRTVLFSTHLIEEAERLDRVIMLHQGRIVADDTPENLRRNAGTSRLIVHGDEWNPDERIAAMTHETATGCVVLLPESDTHVAEEIAGRLARDGVSFSLGPPSLADVFLQRTGDALDRSEGQ